MAFKMVLILSRPQSGRVEGRTPVIQPPARGCEAAAVGTKRTR